MPYKKFIVATVFISSIGLAGCNLQTADTGDQTSTDESATEQALTDSSVENAMASGINALNQSAQLSSMELSTDSSEASALSAGKDSRLGSRGCSNSDPDVTLTYECSDTDHTSTLVRDFGEGCDVGERVVVTGKEYIGWTGMGVPACDGRRRPRFWTAVQGTPADSARRVVSTDPDAPTSPVTAIMRTFPNGSSLHVIGYATTDFSGYQQSGDTQSVNGLMDIPGTSRILYRSNGTTKIFDHTISTPTALSFNLQNTEGMEPVRTIQSGELAVSHNLAKFTVHESFDQVKYDYNECECAPVSGTVDISVTDNTTGNSLGSGTLTFTASETGTCGTLTVSYEGRAVSLPALEQCR